MFENILVILSIIVIYELVRTSLTILWFLWLAHKEPAVQEIYEEDGK